jgi:glucosamine--fructose-6-phosphate aminotransferase (isomerizing)
VASGWSVADATHGPLGQVIDGTPVIVLAASPGGLESVATFSAAAADLGAYLIVVGEHQVGALSTAPSRIPLPELDAMNVPSELVPLIEILPLQLLALSLALERGLNPDQPAGLNKVTRTH